MGFFYKILIALFFSKSKIARFIFDDRDYLLFYLDVKSKDGTKFSYLFEKFLHPIREFRKSQNPDLKLISFDELTQLAGHFRNPYPVNANHQRINSLILVDSLLKIL